MGLFSNCKQMVKYSGTRIEIATVKGPVQVPLSIDGVAIKPQLLQVAGRILRILDWLQFTGCQKIHELKKLKNIPEEIIADLILRQYDDYRMVAQFTIILITACNSPKSFEKVLADWIAAALPKARPWGTSISISPGEEKEEEKLLNNLERLENQATLVEKQIESLTMQLQKMKSKRRRLEKEKEKLQHLIPRYDSVFRDTLSWSGISAPNLLEDELSEAISALPYLSEAISKNEPFDIEKSIKTLMEDR